MTDALQIVFEDTPQVWRAYYDPEGIQGFGKTRELAVAELLESTMDLLATTEGRLVERTKELVQANLRFSQATRWIPVGERLPEGREPVLVAHFVNGYDIDTAYYRGRWEWSDELPMSLAPTHWMPLPEAPK